MPVFTPPPSTDPVIVPKRSVQFDYPYGSPTSTVVLNRSPVMGNTERLNFQRISRNSRGGDPIIFWDNIWPTEDVLSFSFTYVTKSEADQFKNFLDLTLGKDVKMTDHESQVWKGIILNPGVEFTNQGKRDECGNEQFSFSIEFQGVLQSWPSSS